MQLSLNLRRHNSNRWLIFCSAAGDTGPEIGQDRTFVNLDDIASALDHAGVTKARYGPTIRAARDGYESGFLVSSAEAESLGLLDDEEIAKRSPGSQQYRSIR